MPLTSRAPSGTKPPPAAIAASSGSCGAKSLSTWLGVGGFPGLVVIEDDAAVLAEIDAVGARAEAEAAFYREVKSRPRFPQRPLRRRFAAPARFPQTTWRSARSLAAKTPRRAASRQARRADLSALAISSAAMSPGRLSGWSKRKFVQGMMHDLAAHGVVGKLAERLQRLELQNMPREDRIGVGHALLDAGDAELARPCLDGRTGTWWIDRREG